MLTDYEKRRILEEWLENFYPDVLEGLAGIERNKRIDSIFNNFDQLMEMIKDAYMRTD